MSRFLALLLLLALDRRAGSFAGAIIRLLKRFLDIEIERCPNCGGALSDHRRPFDTLRTGIEDLPVIVKILRYLGLPSRAPPRALARRVDLFQTI